MNSIKRESALIGMLFIASMVAGIFSITPAVDSEKYLIEASTNTYQVLLGVASQFMMSLIYVGVGILLYPMVKRFGAALSIGFLSFRIIASTLVVIGTIVLLSILALSQEFTKDLPNAILSVEIVGNMLKITRDYINHVFMILTLCVSNFMMYTLLIKSKLVPKWISIWGLLGTTLSLLASILVLFQVVEIITTEYLVLNVPTAFLELFLGLFLIFKGFDKKKLLADE
ncbi:DUF4386 domain-containing protein [Aquimarina sp. I32.4]|uniref:DUF4386 domain-containing protein n=1 Tax=Aquimarina sp. I32.4 TaxID=2053903 RepID=UPI000CDE640A|nr:DUF4386 domain-containing protein [Aquimarina sp. I32.4]